MADEPDALKRLEQIAKQVKHAERMLTAGTAERDRLIREAHAAGVTYRRIAEVTGVSFQRVAQIVQS